MDIGMTSEAASTITTGTRQFSITQLNCRGLLSKIDYIHHLILTEWRSDIVCLNETWLQPDSTTESHISLENFSSFRRDRPHGSHGGLFVYVNVRVRCRRRLDLEHINIECITLEFYLNNTKHLLFFCYRPPNYSPSVFFNILSTLLSTAEQENSVLTLLGDFNSKHPSWDSSAQPNIAGTKLAGLLLDFGLSQEVRTPTRYSHDGKYRSVLDLFATSRPDTITKVIVSEPISDHCSVSVLLQAHTVPSHAYGVQIPDFNRADWPGLRNALAKAQLLDAILGTTDVNVAWSTWRNIISKLSTKFIPTRTVTIRVRNKPWMTSELHKLARTKRRLFNAAKKSRNPEDWQRYKSARNQCTLAFRKRKSAYFRQERTKLENEIDGSFKWWQKAKKLARISTPNEQIPDLLVDGKVADTPLEKANLLAQFFARQCTDNSGSGTRCGAPYPLRADHPSFDFPPISSDTVLRRLQRLPIHKSTSDTYLTNRFLRECAPFLANSLSFLFNLSLNTSTFPNEWKQAIIVPIFKRRGSPQDPSNYRPVSLLPAIGKLFDAIQSQRLLHYLVSNKLISDHQYGFLPGRSTVMQLVYVIDRFLRALEAENRMSAIFMDFTKAFDRVWHTGLLHKIAASGVSTSSTDWLRSYLDNRLIRVRVGSTLSAEKSISAGVPQGSHLGPILFIVFINDLQKEVECPTEIYADDTLIYHEENVKNGKTQKTHELSLQTAVRNAERWASTWHGKFGFEKTKIITVQGQRKKSAEATMSNSLPTIFIEGKEIQQVSSHRHLGVVLSSQLRWSVHLRSVLLSASKRAGLLRWMSKDLPPDVIKKLYIYYVRPVMEYASPVWHGSITEEEAIAMERVQASVARCVSKSPWSTPKETLFESLDWPSLRWRRDVASMVLFHKLLTSAPTSSFSECIPSFSSSNSVRGTRKPLQLLLNHANTSRYTNSFFYRSSVLWNSLPSNLQAIKNRKTFKITLMERWRSYKFICKKSVYSDVHLT